MTLARFLRSPRWIAGHLLVLLTVVTFASLGFWQLERLDSRRDYNALLDGRMAQESVNLHTLPPEAATEHSYRRVSVTGTYRHDDEVLLSTRSQDGRPGHHVLTPLEAEGLVVVVDRGWVPLDLDEPPIADATPPAGEVTVDGVLHPSQEARRAGTFGGEDGALQFVTDVDLSLLSEALGTDLYPLYVLAGAQEPGQAGALPLPAASPPLTEGSHLSYAMQWFLFTGVVLVGYPMLLRRSYLDQRPAEEDGEPTATAEPPAPVATG
jgi:surfeit locus 1 family protein